MKLLHRSVVLFQVQAAALAIIVATVSPSVAATASQQQQQRLISVRGEGSVMVVPDMAIITRAYTIETPTAVRGFDIIRGRMEDGKQVLLTSDDLDIESQDIQTTGNIQVEFLRKNGPDEYKVYDELMIVVRDITQTGTVLDKLQNEGGTLKSVEFSHADPTVHIQQARKAATNDAKTKAETIVTELGSSSYALGNVKNVVETARIVPASATSIIGGSTTNSNIFVGEENNNNNNDDDESSMFTTASSDNTYRVIVDVTWEINVKGETINNVDGGGGGGGESTKSGDSASDNNNNNDNNNDNSGSQRSLKKSGGWKSISFGGFELVLLLVPFFLHSSFWW